ncbi:hypothetical protein ACSFEV_12145 [Pseudomonas fulva]|uniref:hypothetical protein n=1 Tax=Pseudomonas fulva TaxID=47880 RepID=UPI003EEA542C
MPTENRSSNTEMVSVPRHWAQQTVSAGPGECVSKSDIALLSKALADPAQQPHPNPIAWMVGTAFWRTKEEAERDAEETGLPIVGLGPMAGEQQQGEPVAWLDKESGAICTAALKPVIGNGFTTALYTHADPGEVERLRNEHTEAVNVGMRYQDQCKALRAQLAEAQALLRDIEKRHWSVEFDLPCDLLERLKALSGSAEPEAT